MVSSAAPTNAEYATALGRGFIGALIFALPMLMTAEMWELGFRADPLRIALFLAIGWPLLIGLSYYSGFRKTFSLADDLLDAAAAYALGFVASGVLLLVIAVIEPGMGWREIVGKIAVQALPSAVGALLARSQLSGGGGDKSSREGRSTYAGELFLMLLGALFLAFNVAPTEEASIIAHQMSDAHAIMLALSSLLLLHLVVFKLGFAGQEEGHVSGSGWRTFLFYTLAGYGLALLMCLYILWTFGAVEGDSLESTIKTVVVLGFPASLGAALARLLI